MKRLLLLSLAVLPLAGCTSTNITQLVKALGSDPATVSFRVTGPYGSVSFVRTSPLTNQTVTVSQDGAVTIR
jgi:uncharacterized protein YcfL